MTIALSTRPEPELKVRNRHRLSDVSENEKRLTQTPLKELLAHLPDWTTPFFEHRRFKALYGGRGSGKSHFLAELLVARMVKDRDLQVICIREKQKSLNYSAKLLIQRKIKALGYSHLFDIQHTIIKRKGGDGLCIFQGMQDHTADSIKSLEGFGVAWCEEAATMSQYSLDLLIPTIRSPGSELWFSWNPEQPDDPVDQMFRGGDVSPRAIVKKVGFRDNPFLTDILKEEEQEARERDPEKHEWIWEGGYNVKSDAVIFSGKWRIDEFEVSKGWDGPYYGADWGFSVDPTVAIEAWVVGNQIYISRESYAYRLEIDRTAKRWIADIPGIQNHKVKADNSRSESISLVRRSGIYQLVPCEKWPSSVEEGIEWLKSYEIVVHPECQNTILELKRYRYKTNRAGEVTTQIVDKDNHAIDSLRYALGPLIRNQGKATPAQSRSYKGAAKVF
ncbi:MAG: PBSX family phage terminase large subunit [Cyanobacteria bacterium P01_A01_bin.17]